MEITNIFEMLGGLGLFLFGMTLMSSGLELAAGNRLKAILEKLTANRFVGVGVGAIVAALTQSSSATTVMAIGFVNSGLMNLESAVWIIMGANIGTTITGQLIALNISAYAPFILFMGVMGIMFFKKGRAEATAQVLVGLGMLFIGLEQMSHSMIPLRTMPEFTALITQFQNPFIGIAVGAIFTAIIQSSSASVGILQSLALSGVITLPSAIYVLFGQNIGTCATAVLASLGAERNAKRATWIHLLFNIIGTVVFVVISMVTPFAEFVASFTPNNVPAQIANVHTVFNIVTTLLLLPFGKQLVAFTFRILPKLDPAPENSVIQYLDFDIFEHEYHVGTTTLVEAQLFKETQYMLSLVQESIDEAFSLGDDAVPVDNITKIQTREDEIDRLNQEIIRYASMALAYTPVVEGELSIGRYVKLASDLERVGDHAMNIMERLVEIRASGNALSDAAQQELTEMGHMSSNSLKLLSYDQLVDSDQLLIKVAQLEQQIDDAYVRFETNQIKRLKEKRCHLKNSVQFAKILTDFERIGDHCLNIAQSLVAIHPAAHFMHENESEQK